MNYNENKEILDMAKKLEKEGDNTVLKTLEGLIRR